MADDTRDLDSTKASMNPYTLNNMVTKLRPVVKKVRLRVIQKLIKSAKGFRRKKGSDIQKMENERKAKRLIEEALKIKKLDVDLVTKFALANTSSWEEVSRKGDSIPLETRILTRLSCHDLLQEPVNKWRSEHEDWKSLAAFLLSKGTGRRMKKKKKKKVPGKEKEDAKVKAKKLVESVNVAQGSLQVKPDANVRTSVKNKEKLTTSPVNVKAIPKHQNEQSEKKSSVDIESEDLSSLDGDSVEESSCHSDEIPSDVSEQSSDVELELSQEKQSSKTKKVNSKESKKLVKSVQKQEVPKASQEKDKTKTISKIPGNVSHGDMVVRQLTLEDLENLEKLKFDKSSKKDVSFLFVKDSQSKVSDVHVNVKKTKRKDAFFVNSDSSDTSADDLSDLGTRVDEEIEDDSASSEEEEDEEERRRKVSLKGKKSIKSTFLGNLSQISIKKSKKQGDKEHPRSKSEQSNRWQGKSSRGPSRTPAPQGKKLDLRHVSQKKMGKGSIQTKSALPENLHPSWEASRKRKEQAKITIQPFQGKKIKFDED